LQLTDKVWSVLQKFFFGQWPPCTSPPPRPSIFFRLFFSVHHLVNRDDRHLLAHAMCNGLWLLSCMAVSLKENNCFFPLRIKLHALIQLGVSPPSSVLQKFRVTSMSWFADNFFRTEYYYIFYKYYYKRGAPGTSPIKVM
jgi:hypothetical protein